MAKFLPVCPPQPSLMLEKARGIHLWFLWIISSAQLCISTTPLPALPEDTSWARNRHSRTRSIQGQSSTPRQSSPAASARARQEYLKGRPGLECVTGIRHFQPGSGPTAFPSSIPPCPEHPSRTTPLGQEKVPSNFSAQPVLCSTWKNHCSSAGMHTNDKYASEAIN